MRKRKKTTCKYKGQSEFDVDVARRMLNKIPDDASVCATTFFTPHLALRDSVYLFPSGLQYNAEYFLVKKKHWSYSSDDTKKVSTVINGNPLYEVLDTNGDLYLLRKKR